MVCWTGKWMGNNGSEDESLSRRAFIFRRDTVVGWPSR